MGVIKTMNTETTAGDDTAVKVDVRVGRVLPPMFNNKSLTINETDSTVTTTNKNKQKVVRKYDSILQKKRRYVKRRNKEIQN